MKKTAAGTSGSPTQTSPRPAPADAGGRIHPVVIYPFRQPDDYADLEQLYQLIARLAATPDTYARPLTVVDRKTQFAMAGNKRFLKFRQDVVAAHSDILDVWSVDTCQMWYSGLGTAFDRGGPGDVYWLIPGDFNYGTAMGKEVLGGLHHLPEIVSELHQDFCVGEIATDHSNSKQLIDTYGTFALLYNWFPAEAQAIRQITERPRSEFFALRHEFLAQVLHERWYAYEQTVVMLLKAIAGKKQISRFFVGHISDLPEGRESLESAVQQVERTERVLKSLWREQHHHRAGWFDRYRHLELQSEQVLRTGLIVLENLLG